MICISCQVVKPFDEFVCKFGQYMFDVICNQFYLIYIALLSVWIIYQIIRNMILKCNLDISWFVSVMIVNIIIGIMLKNHEVIWQWLYAPLMKCTNDLLLTIIQGGYHELVENKDLMGLLSYIEKYIIRIIHLAKIYAESASAWYIKPLITALILLIPYTVLWLLFVFSICEYLFKFMLMAALSPLFIVAAAFNQTKFIAINSLVAMLQATLRVILAVLSMSITITVMKIYFQNIPLDESNTFANLSQWSFSEGFWTCIIVACLAIMFQLKGYNLATALLVKKG